MGNVQDTFTKIYKNNTWGSEESVSGTGSTLQATQILRITLPVVFDCLGIKTLVDAPCGDRNWIRQLPYSFVKYIGVDIVQELIQKHNATKDTQEFFQVGDITTDILPTADAILCRDCLGHLPLALGKRAIRMFKHSGAKHLLSTTFPSITENTECAVGGWRPINLQLHPYTLPPPVCLINETVNGNKYLGVWKLNCGEPE